MEQQIAQDLKMLCTATGVSGYERGAAQVACTLLRRYIPDAACDRFGNVTGLLSTNKPDAKTLLLDAHIDEIGMIVTGIDEKGFLRVGRCGGIDLRILPAQYVTVHGKQDILGIVGSVPPHLQKSDDAKKYPTLEDSFIDIGMTKEHAEEIVSLGDRVTFCSEFVELPNGRVSCKALDDRAGCVSILAALDLLQADREKGGELPLNIAVQFSGREETGGQGAQIAAFNLNPNLAVAVDVGFAYVPDEKKEKCGKLGGGPMIGYSPALDPELSDRMRDLAKEHSIPWQYDAFGGRGTGTNADSITVTRSGVRASLLSIPQRYMHTPMELMELRDIADTARLIAEFIRIGGQF